MKKLILPILVLFVTMVLLSGCTTTPQEGPQTEPATSAPTAEPSPAVTGTPGQELSFAEAIAIIQKRTDEAGPITMAMNTTTYLAIQENPTTGYLWNATVTPGLSIVNDTFIPPAEAMDGAGGMRAWTVEAVAPGNQTFTAVYHRPWEHITPEDITYTVYFVVTD
ncbi:MAG: protease inhibitor I42 family protein [Methanoregulaceae archaeon]|jgi:inhibitor of cysteine peptidase